MRYRKLHDPHSLFILMFESFRGIEEGVSAGDGEGVEGRHLDNS